MAIKWVATTLSAILPGTGQLITRHWAKGGLFLLGALVMSGMLRRGSFLTSEFGDDSLLHLVFMLGLLALAVWSAVDVFRSFKENKAAA